MNEYKLQDGTLVNERELRASFSNVVLPKPLTTAALAHINAIPVLITPKPDASSPVKSVVRNGVTTDANGNTVQAWMEVDAFSDYTDENNVVVTKAEQETAHLAKLLSDAADAKCIEINNKTKDDIIALVGDSTKQRNSSAKASQLLLKKVNNTSTVADDTLLDQLNALFAQVETLIADGNALEASVRSMATIAEIEAVIVAV